MENKDMKFNLYCKDFKVKSNGDKEVITIEGYANTTSKDRQGDVILEEAWSKGGLDNYLRNPIVLAYHNPEKPIGEVTDYGVNNKGLHVVAEISKAAGDVYTLIKEGILKAFSVGFRVKDADYDTDTDIFVIKDLEMYELSVVSIPANAEAIFSIRKSFEKEEDYIKFKNQYIKQEVIVEPTKEQNTIASKENKKVDKDELTFTKDDLEAAKKKAVEDALAAIEAEKEELERIKNIALEVSSTGAERLLADINKKFEEEKTSIGSVIDELRSELKEKAAELESMRNSKMTFSNPTDKAVNFTQQEIDTAVLASKALGVAIADTNYFKNLIKTKTGAHIGDLTGLGGSNPEEWENRFSTALYQDIKDRTIMEPLFTNRIQMTSRTMVFPYNPEAGVAQWIADSAYRTANSTGTAVDHKPLDNTLKAEKLASKEYIGYEEEEDAIIAIMPIIRDAVVRRMVRTTDVELLRANAESETLTGQGNTPAGFNGVSTLAADATGYDYTQPGVYGDPITVADLQQTRRLMGSPGLMPGDVVYIVSQSAYYDLLEDPDFRTIDVVGPNATILRGQVSSVNGSPVIISDAFAADAAGTVQAICLNASNYLFGELRGMTVERDRDIEQQKNIIVATRRFAFTEIVPAVAAATKRQSYCANLKRPAA